MFPHYHQLEARDCAPTCLRIISRFYGKKYSAEELRDLCSVTKQGSSLQDIIDAANILGFDTLSLSFAPDKITEIPLPAILYWRQEHYVVLYGIEKHNKDYLYRISDPGFGKVTLNQDLFLKQWLGNNDGGIALLLEPNERFSERVPLKISQWKPLIVASKNFFKIFRSNSFKSFAAIGMIMVAMVCTWLFPSVFGG
jgi:ATP-binding cassette subfamily B protein